MIHYFLRKYFVEDWESISSMGTYVRGSWPFHVRNVFWVTKLVGWRHKGYSLSSYHEANMKGWYAYYMVDYEMLRTYDGKLVFSKEKN